MRTVIAKRGEVLLTASFQSPAFTLLNPPASEFHEKVYSNLAKYGLTLSDIRIESTLNPLSEASVKYDLHRQNSLVKLSLDRLEIYFFSLNSIDEQTMVEIVNGALNAVTASHPEIRFADFTANVGVHGVFEGGKLEEYLSEHIKQSPEGFGPVSGRGIVYYLGPTGNTKSASFTIDVSLVISGGVYFRTVFTLDGTKVGVTDLTNIAIKKFYEMYKIMNIDLKWDN